MKTINVIAVLMMLGCGGADDPLVGPVAASSSGGSGGQGGAGGAQDGGTAGQQGASTGQGPATCPDHDPTVCPYPTAEEWQGDLSCVSLVCSPVSLACGWEQRPEGQECDEGKTCDADGMCVAACVPEAFTCEGKCQTWENNCSELFDCGECAAGFECENYYCVAL